MVKMVYNQRNKEFGDWEVMIMTAPLIIANPSTGSTFLQFNSSCAIEDGSGQVVMEKFIGWGHPELLFHLRTGALNMFVDCTFKTVPRGFYQLLILMAYLPAYETYVPMFYVLMQSKKYNAYKYVLSHMVLQTDWKLLPKTITCDFEKALIKAVKEEFQRDNVPLKACEFHWKQCLRRKLLEFGVKSDAVSKIMSKDGYIDILLYIPVDEIVSKGIPFVRSKIDECPFQSAYNSFWNYFIKIWMNDYDPRTWNLNAFQEEEDILINRTNNPLERYNRTLNEMLPAHPTMAVFVEAIQGESRRFVDLLQDIKLKRVKPSNHKKVVIPNIPQEYIDFSIEINENVLSNPKKVVHDKSSLVEPPKKRFVYKK